MAYREARDPREVAAEIWLEAQRREIAAATQKTRAAGEVALKQHALEAARARLGAVTALGRHLDALAATEQITRAAREWNDEERAVIRDIEERRAAFLREQGVDPGPSLLPEARAHAAAIGEQIESTRVESETARDAVARAEQELADAGRELERTEAEMKVATEARLEAEAELERHQR